MDTHLPQGKAMDKGSFRSQNLKALPRNHSEGPVSKAFPWLEQMLKNTRLSWDRGPGGPGTRMLSEKSVLWRRQKMARFRQLGGGTRKDGMYLKRKIQTLPLWTPECIRRLCYALGRGFTGCCGFSNTFTWRRCTGQGVWEVRRFCALSRRTTPPAPPGFTSLPALCTLHFGVFMID